MRGKRVTKKIPEKDKKYGSVLVTRLINKVMLHGKKKKAEDIVYKAIDEAKKKANVDAQEFLDKVFSNIRPALEVRSRRVGGANYQVPVAVNPDRQDTLAIRWLVTVCRKKSGKEFYKILAEEMLLAYKGEGDAVKKRQDVEKMAEANKAFAHLGW